ncbi:histidinol-phosphate aminotransferase [Fomitiporia mediterranea MF3/22]|uniref:histidinol-phosphate aminotransferase n=1 Tax=Fomitiporia mediterranea (strain MF3/22) TaxID=694068 RepID=UPI0004408F48|nr:histidinol-phosphate aminotransferase [Fomitiporia mediterranea MF3/22]EJD05551.1 histidinol-phosphate aminotransferase [Fomitiporia mediterranea MF3/22]
MPILGLQPSSASVYPPHFDIESIIRPNILTLQPYRCARDDYQEGILLDANENSLGHSIPTAPSKLDAAVSGTGPDFSSLDLNRYPDPAQREIKSRIAKLRGLTTAEGVPKDDHVFLGVGSDEVIDLLMRVCVAPGREKIMTTPPTYGMYAVCAQVNDLEVVKVPLNAEKGAFQLRIDEIKRAVDEDPSVKLIFLCSPGNPSGTLISLADVQQLLEYPKFKGIIIIDEAYIDFSPPEMSAVTLVEKYANLCVMQTLSKSFGLAAIRLGVAIAQPPLIQILTNTKAPYNISTPTATLALSALSPEGLSLARSRIATLTSSRIQLLKSLQELRSLGLAPAIGGNHANFLMVPVLDKAGSGKPDNVRSERVYKELAEREGIVVRFRGREHGCEGCLRITVGTEEENRMLLRKLGEVLQRI